jgi:hypothetical protein
MEDASFLGWDPERAELVLLSISRCPRVDDVVQSLDRVS